MGASQVSCTCRILRRNKVQTGQKDEQGAVASPIKPVIQDRNNNNQELAEEQKNQQNDNNLIPIRVVSNHNVNSNSQSPI